MREYSDDWKGEDIAIATIAALFTVTSLGWLIFVLAFWKHEVVKAASPVFLVVTLIGSILLYLSVLTFIPVWVSDLTCNLKIWMISLGFTLMFGALFAKSCAFLFLFFFSHDSFFFI